MWLIVVLGALVALVMIQPQEPGLHIHVTIFTALSKFFLGICRHPPLFALSAEEVPKATTIFFVFSTSDPVSLGVTKRRLEIIHL
jgi:hypothetical protein